MFNLHDEYNYLLFIIVIIFIFLISLTIYIGYNMKGNHKEVNTLISLSFP